MRPSLDALLWGLSALCLAACQGGSREVAGTSTSVGTSIGGTAARSDGRPAAGALAIARDEEVVWIDGRPESRLIDSARSDSLGRFRLASPGRSFRLEILCDTARACSDGTEVWYDWADISGGRLPHAVLAPPGSLEGRWQPVPGEEAPWIGIAGTGRFTRPDSGSRFRLDGIAAGNHFLTILRKTGNDPAQSQKTGTWKVESGKVTGLGVLR